MRDFHDWESARAMPVKTFKELKEKAYAILGNKCADCGLDEIAVLQLDHIRNNGAADRRQVAAKFGKEIYSTQVFYARVVQGSRDYQILCANCNWRKRKRRYPRKSQGGR